MSSRSKSYAQLRDDAGRTRGRDAHHRAVHQQRASTLRDGKATAMGVMLSRRVLLTVLLAPLLPLGGIEGLIPDGRASPDRARRGQAGREGGALPRVPLFFVASLLPEAWMFSTAFKAGRGALMPPTWIPTQPPSRPSTVLAKAPFGRFYVTRSFKESSRRGPRAAGATNGLRLRQFHFRGETCSSCWSWPRC